MWEHIHSVCAVTVASYAQGYRVSPKEGIDDPPDTLVGTTWRLGGVRRHPGDLVQHEEGGEE